MRIAFQPAQTKRTKNILIAYAPYEIGNAL
jgi:hypothetical protein